MKVVVGVEARGILFNRANLLACRFYELNLPIKAEDIKIDIVFTNISMNV